MQPLFIYLSFHFVGFGPRVWIRVQTNADWGFKTTGQVRLQKTNKLSWKKANEKDWNTAWAKVSWGADIACISLSRSLSASNPPHSGFSVKQENNAREGHLNEVTKTHAEQDQFPPRLSKYQVDTTAACSHVHTLCWNFTDIGIDYWNVGIMTTHNHHQLK